MSGKEGWVRRFGAPVWLIAMLASASGAAAVETEAEDAAQDADAPTATQTETDTAPPSGPISIPPVSVYATRSPTPVLDYPGRVTVIDRERIQTLQPSSVFDVLQGVPGVQVQGGPRRTGQSISIRGLEGEGVVILVDGARQSFVSGHDGRVFIEPSMLQAVEVIRGPGSALYGSGALGGVIAFRTVEAGDFLEPGETFGAEIGVGYQDVNQEVMGHGTVFGRTEDGRYSGVASVVYRNADDIELGSGLTLPSDDDLVSGLVSGTADLSDALSITGSYLSYRLDTADPNNPQANNLVDSTNALVDRSVASDTVRLRIAYAPLDSDWIDLAVVPYFTRASVEEPEATSDRYLVREVNTFGITADNRTRFQLADSIDSVLTYGLEFYRDEQDGEDSDGAGGVRGGVPNAHAEVFAVFLQNEITFADLGFMPGELSFVPAVRYDHYANEADGQAEVTDDAVSPRIAMRYEPAPWVNLFASYARGFRAPSMDELYSGGVHFSLPVPPTYTTFVNNEFVGNPNLLPEHSETIEIGFGLDFQEVVLDRDLLTAEASYYWSEVDNLIDLQVNIPAACFGAPSPPLPPCGSGMAFGNYSTYVNVANAHLEGFELELDYDSPRFYAQTSFATIDGEDRDTGQPIGVLFPNRFYADLGTRIPEADLRLGSRITVAADFNEVADASLERDGYAVFDLYATWEPTGGPLDGLRLDVGVENVADTDYDVVSAGVSEPGRNFYAGLSYRLTF
ncbi:MAG: TonB-dependent hemoglobin/transferrin/lactoferrin family receptor [Rhodospirillaceae bacterium]|nr:TonB-dependent hemoglobin/transferrin/lactoferrin family receptor [Rhodospirillaceae bacterium]